MVRSVSHLRELKNDYYFPPKVVAIGASTGGPKALSDFLKLFLPVSQPVLITQHVPSTFNELFAEYLQNNTGHKIVQAEDHQILELGMVYCAPADYHMVVVLESLDKKPSIKLMKTSPENFCRPSVDPMLKSVAQFFGKHVLAFIFTGMGQDGLKGCKILSEKGAIIMAQDKSSSVVWGMPGAVSAAGLCHLVAPIETLAKVGRELVIGKTDLLHKYSVLIRGGHV